MRGKEEGEVSQGKQSHRPPAKTLFIVSEHKGNPVSSYVDLLWRGAGSARRGWLAGEDTEPQRLGLTLKNSERRK